MGQSDFIFYILALLFVVMRVKASTFSEADLNNLVEIVELESEGKEKSERRPNPQKDEFFSKTAQINFTFINTKQVYCSENIYTYQFRSTLYIPPKFYFSL